jgi:hypothetical protein
MRAPSSKESPVKPYALTVVAAVALGLPAVAGAGKIVLQDSVPGNDVAQVSVTLRKPGSFKVLLRTSTQGRTRLYLLGAHAPKAGPLIDTKTYACDGTAGSFYCKGSYETLPRGTYAFRVAYAAATPLPAHIELTVQW